jgi:FkbM family methyltransferase
MAGTLTEVHLPRKPLKSLLERLFHVRVYSTHPHGRDDCHDIQQTGREIATVFDVGANNGSSALKFLDAFPAATIHCFEPVTKTFEILQANVAARNEIRCHRLAMGSAPGVAKIFLTTHDTMSSLIRPETVLGEEPVTVTTVDEFAAAQNIDRIDLLKVDAEGFDLDVLRGAEGMLASDKIAFVLAEVGFHPGDARHVLFDDVRDFLSAKGFFVFGFYDQQLEWSGEQKLRYANVCFRRTPGIITASLA